MSQRASKSGDQPRSRAHAASATALLADRASRAIVTLLGEARGRPMSAAALTDAAPIDATPRLIRDRVRELERAGILEATTPALAAGAPAASLWQLTPAGQDLHRLQSLLGRIVAHAAQLTATTPSGLREHVVELTLKGLSDPVIVQIARCLAAGPPLDPVTLELACSPTPRRTIYRRLGPLVSGGVVVRTTSRQVPRSTHYALAPRWRPAAAILMLSAWWESRHRDLPGQARAIDLEGLVLAILPTVRLGPGHDGRALRWVVDHPDAGCGPLLAVDGDRLTITGSGPTKDETSPDATVAGASAAWTEALVTDRRDALTITGDAALAGEVLDAVRAALLMYIR